MGPTTDRGSTSSPLAPPAITAPARHEQENGREEVLTKKRDTTLPLPVGGIARGSNRKGPAIAARIGSKRGSGPLGSQHHEEEHGGHARLEEGDSEKPYAEVRREERLARAIKRFVS